MKAHAPATDRNRGPIAEVLARELPEAGLVLEVASGTGEHVAFFAALFPGLLWQPTDIDAAALASIAAHRADASAPNILAPRPFDTTAAHAPVDRADALLAINMVHISPWPATLGLFRHAAALLADGGALVLYGPYIEPEVALAPSNARFDADLRRRNPRWGLRDTREMDLAARDHGFERAARYALPANNIVLVYRLKPDP